MIYAFAGVDVNNLTLSKTQDSDDDGVPSNKRGRYFVFNNLKLKNPGLKTLLSVGGATSIASFSHITESDASITKFARNAAVYLRQRDFDGIDVDWEWPGQTYRNKFSLLLRVRRFLPFLNNKVCV